MENNIGKSKKELVNLAFDMAVIENQIDTLNDSIKDLKESWMLLKAKLIEHYKDIQNVKICKNCKHEGENHFKGGCMNMRVYMTTKSDSVEICKCMKFEEMVE